MNELSKSAGTRWFSPTTVRCCMYTYTQAIVVVAQTFKCHKISDTTSVWPQ